MTADGCKNTFFKYLLQTLCRNALSRLLKRRQNVKQFVNVFAFILSNGNLKEVVRCYPKCRLRVVQYKQLLINQKSNIARVLFTIATESITDVKKTIASVTPIYFQYKV